MSAKSYKAKLNKFQRNIECPDEVFEEILFKHGVTQRNKGGNFKLSLDLINQSIINNATNKMNRS